MTTRRSTAAEWAYAITLFFRPSTWHDARKRATQRAVEDELRRRGLEPLFDVSGVRQYSNMHSMDELPVEVILRRDDPYLRDYHQATYGQRGVAVQHSRLGPDDNGLLVDWGHGGPVRMNRDEIALAANPSRPTRDENGKWSYTWPSGEQPPTLPDEQEPRSRQSVQEHLDA